ncbi:hypothetical protein H010_21266 [Hydrogenophaga taeniospiralis CCUG 15921]|uniref:Uncharacterized protein n=1 Tax=Hydrogenophaga taeniospiralis CCUG 15921 TaxID=1281780 RepID=A0A9X4SAC5_9BURK|nr:hypothetical protein [Hydrogenophaga taeniospiralis]MDG5977795.1 hypothetical protein [Hydrogenophaga taeniospiralis CCUG 15921]
MSPARAPGAAPPPLTAEVRAVLACDRLARNRERLSGWLEQDRRHRAERSAGGWLAGALWPVLQGLGSQPVVSLALGALARGWQQRTPATPPAPPLEEPLALGAAALAVVRRHPKTSLAVGVIAGAALLWSRRHRSPP